MELKFSIPRNNTLNLPDSNPETGKAVKYCTEDGTPLIPMKRQYQGYIDNPPARPEQLWKNACSNDELTISSWNDTWSKNLKANCEKYDVHGLSCWKFFSRESFKPVIIAGSGPSIKTNSKYLKPHWDNKTNPETGKVEEMLTGGRHEIRIVSCLHNFGYFEDNNIMGKDDYYLNLDAGDLTISEVYEGGSKEESWYWERSKDRTLITTVFANPVLLEKWQGEIFFFQTPSSSVKGLNELVDISVVPTFSVGGNALGACLYFAKAILGGSDIVFIGADFAFDYSNKFHGWKSPYDKQFSGVIPVTDVFGNRVWTWASYFNFKCYMDFVAGGGKGGNPQSFINCTEGGILGAYPEGNIQQIKQMSLKECLTVYNMHKNMPLYLENANKIPLVLF